ncbi:MAG TPA: hypothetical protein VLM40_02640, partial [Gemmata sp.]|nr:hypothetical protein [Gemmata sp.]
MNTEHKDSDQNALGAKLGQIWTEFKQGKIISYRMMAIVLILFAVLAGWWYFSSASRKATSQRWVEFDSANSEKMLSDLANQDKDSLLARIAELQIARAQLGRDGLDKFGDLRPEVRQKAVESVEKSRESFDKLLNAFKDDPVLRGECLWALAMAEEGLVGVPKDAGKAMELGPIAPAKESKGDVEKVLDYYKQLEDLQAKNPKIT